MDVTTFPGADVIVLDVSDDDDVMEVAIDLGLTTVPSALITERNEGKDVVVSKLEGDAVTIESIKSAVESGVKGAIQDGYKGVAKTKDRGEGGCCVSVASELNGYSRADLMAAGVNADLGVGCGNPMSFAYLTPGETVVDLGSGAGIDCFIAATKVNPGGRVVGVDMTPEMVKRARGNAKEKGYKGEEVQFRLGEIEHLPVPNGFADVVISNCVINLSSDKPQVFREVFRVLKDGGRIAISDVIERDGVTIPSNLRTAEALACWVAGAPEKDTLMESLVGAGFVNVEIKEKEESREVIKQWIPGSGAEDFVVSAEVTARKPELLEEFGVD